MSEQLKSVRIGLALVLLGLYFGVGLGIAFGTNEDAFKNYINRGVTAHPEAHDADSTTKIWRYVVRAHFHSTGIAAFSLGLIILVVLSDIQRTYKTLSSVLIGLSSFYALSWFSMFILAPAVGRGPAHDHIVTQLFIYIGVGGLLAGSLILIMNLFLGKFKDTIEFTNGSRNRE